MNEEVLFTSAALLDFLSQVDELQDKNIAVNDTNGSTMQITIGDSTYDINLANAEPIEVEPEVVDEVSEVIDETLDSMDIDTMEDIEGGIIKEALKSMALGGLIRLTGKLLK